MALQTPFTDPAMPAPGNEGDLSTHRGGDPNVPSGGSSGLQPVWTDDRPMTDVPPTETANMSGLPTHIDRFQPSGTPPAPPDLTDRMPGTIDER